MPKGQNNLTLSDYQQKVHQWITTHGVRYFNELTNTVLLMEEMGEFARLMARTFGEQSFRKKDKGKKIEDEMADVFFVLTCLANQMNISLEDALLRNLEKRSKRDRKRHKQNKKLST
ncbi:MAG: nucleotide pyrophosphohydrolase [Bacteroidia bacterium]|nr:nucleotide pyrophosphohydrolase [Bacteroidia bacterium]